jgi:tryptophan synthase alpha chain
VTGAQTEIATGIAEQVKLIQSATKVPVCVGFGISTPAQAGAVAGMADGVVVGSAIVKLVQQHGANADVAARVAEFVKPLVDAVKSV